MDRVEVRRDDGTRCFVPAPLVGWPPAGSRTRAAAQPTGAPPRARQRRDLVARFFAERMSTRTGYVVPATPELVGGAGLYAVHAAVPGVRVQWALRVRAAAQRERQLLTAQSSYGA